MGKVFVMGDSISCSYGKYLEPMLAGRFTYDRKGRTHKLEDLEDGTNGVNGGDSSMVLIYLEEIGRIWQQNAPDYLLLNCGLHDIKWSVSKARHQVPIEEYEQNLNAIHECVHGLGVAIIWVSTTPVLDLPEKVVADPVQTVRFSKDVIAYNTVADRVMAEHGIPVIDLYSFSRNLGPGIYSDLGVHFKEDAAAKQAAFMAGVLWSMGDRG